ncbi:MAG: CDP-alcohol phosphatidyltransferase family protein [Chloroflexi bacterium]|nr:CDP-alcohol phosphatidyltransferase family protein [Chloroflexota bacterium]
MPAQPPIHKLPDRARFFDISDYARPVARLIVSTLLYTRVSPIHLTIAFTVAGLSAAGLFAAGGYAHGLLAGLLLLVKSALDAADGSLSRARGRPSRVGRYLDSVCDVLVNLAVFEGLAWAESARTGSGWPFAVAAMALAIATLEGSVFHYYYIVKRLSEGDTTSLLDEREALPYPWDNPGLTRILQLAYLVIYGWQDRLMAWLDRLVTSPQPPRPPAPSHPYLTATTALGLGTQLLIIAVYAVLGHPYWALYFFLGPGLAYWGLLLIVRKWTAEI